MSSVSLNFSSVGETLVTHLPPGDSKSSSPSPSLTISDCQKSTILIFDVLSSAKLSNLDHCKIVIGCLNGPLEVVNCTALTLTVGCQSVRVKGSTNCHFYLFTNQSPVIESSSKIHFHPFDVSYPQQSFHWDSCGLSTSLAANVSLYATVVDESAENAAIKKPHKIIESATPVLREISLPERPSWGSPSSPLVSQSLVKYSTVSKETPQTIAAGDLIPAATLAAAVAASARKSPSPSPTHSSDDLKSPASPSAFSDLADQFLENSSSEASVPSTSTTAAANATALPSSIQTLINQKSRGSTFTFSTPSLEVTPQPSDPNDIIASMEQYGRRKSIGTEEGKMDAAATATPVKPKAAAESKPSPAVSMDSLWQDLVKSEAKPTEKEMKKQEADRLAQRNIQKAFEEESKAIHSVNAAFEAATQKSADAVAADGDAAKSTDPNAENELKKLEAQRQADIDAKLAAAEKGVQEVAKAADAQHEANRKERVKERAAQNKAQNTSSLSSPSDPLSWESVVSLIPPNRISSSEAQRRLNQFRGLLMGSKGVISSSPSSPPSSSPPPSSPPLSPEDSALSAFLSSLGLSNVLPIFQSEGITLDVIPLLEKSDLTALLPQLGPRRKLQNWIIKQRKDMGIELGDYQQTEGTEKGGSEGSKE